VCNCFTVKVSVNNFKVDKCENLDNDMTLPKNVKSRVFWILKNVRNVFLNYGCQDFSTCSLFMSLHSFSGYPANKIRPTDGKTDRLLSQMLYHRMMTAWQTGHSASRPHPQLLVASIAGTRCRKDG